MTYLPIKNPPVNVPNAHAIVIGVGKYQPSDDRWKLADLESPIASAVAFAQWLLQEYSNQNAPLASVDLLLSHPTRASSAIDGQGNPVDIEAATMPRVRNAITRWFAKCNESLDNVAIFYFCGHGFQKGSQQFLLLEGYGAPNKLTFADDGIDFQGFYDGMERCRARKQMYVLDACRTVPQAALNIQSSLGLAIVDPDYSAISTTLTRDAPALCSAAEGRSAFSRDDQISRFTAALLRALRGAGWDDRVDPWRSWSVNVDNLATFIRQLLSYEETVRGEPYQSAQNAGRSAGFVFHQPPDGAVPIVPLLIGCQDTFNNGRMRFEVKQAGNVLHARDPAALDWELELPAAKDYLIAANDGQNSSEREIILRPAYQIARL